MIKLFNYLCRYIPNTYVYVQLVLQTVSNFNFRTKEFLLKTIRFLILSKVLFQDFLQNKINFFLKKFKNFLIASINGVLGVLMNLRSWFFYKLRFFYFFKLFKKQVKISKSRVAMAARLRLYFAYAVDYVEYANFCYEEFIYRSYEDRDYNKYNKRIWEEDFKQLRFDVLRFLRDTLIAFVNNPGLFLYPVWVRENVPREFSFWTKSLKTFFKDLWYIARDVFWSLYYMDSAAFKEVFTKKEKVEESISEKDKKNDEKKNE